MSDATEPNRGDDETPFYRTLPVFDSRDRRTVQSLLHYAVATDRDEVADFPYDHPDRKVARDIYHDLREGEAIRLVVGTNLRGVGLVLTYDRRELDVGSVLERFESVCESAGHEWPAVAADLRRYRQSRRIDEETEIGFEYRY
jgi:hypothetical protein